MADGDDQQTQQTVDWQSDPDFHQLPLAEKHKVLLDIDSDYKALPPKEQSKALNEIHYGQGGAGTGKEFTNKVEQQPGFAKSFMPGAFDTFHGMEYMAPETKSAPPVSFPPVPIASTIKNDPKRKAEGRSLPYRIAAGIGETVEPLTGYQPRQAEEEAAQGHGATVMGQAANATAFNLLPAAGEAAHWAGNKVTENVLKPRRLEKGTERVLKALDTPGGKGGEKAAKMEKAVNDTRADLAEIERNAPAKGKGAQAYKDLAEKISDRREEIWNDAHKPGIERHKDAPITDYKKVVEAGRAAITEEARDAAPDEAAAADKFINNLDKPRTLGSADKLIREINEDLRGQNAATRYGKLQVRARQAIVEELRNQVDSTLEEHKEQGVKESNRRWGALGEVEARTKERAVQLARAEAKKGPIPDWVHLYTFLHPASLIPTIGAGIKISGMLKSNPGKVLNKGLRNLSGTNLEASTQAPTPPGWRIGPEENPARLLPAPRTPITQLPPPGTAELMHPELFPRAPNAVEAPRQTYRDVATGRMQRGYKGEYPPATVGHTAEGGPMRESMPPEPRRAERTEERRSAMQQYAGTERRSLRDITGPSLMRQSNMRVLQSIIDDPMATARDKAIASQQLDDLRAHPFERNEETRSMQQIKAEGKPKMTRAEAEAVTKKRAEARKKRFEEKR